MATAIMQPTQETVVLGDRRSVMIRPISPADAAPLGDFVARCSADSLYLRFHSGRRRLRTGEAEYLAAADGRERIALVATVDGRLVADARVEPLRGADGEAAVLIADELHRCGLGRALLSRLIELATARGYRRLLLHVLPENAAMVRLAGRFGATPIATDGWTVTLGIALPLSQRFGG
jgi:GNAT superfamily N-acetyltransferase